MSEVVGSAIVEIHARLDALEGEVARGATKAGAKAGEASGKAFTSSFRKTAGAFTAGFIGAGAITGLARQFTRLGKESVSAASNLNEQLSKTRTVFGQASKAVEQFTEGSSAKLGLASDQVLEIASSFGALLRPLGLTEKLAADQSTALTTLGADLASFYNTDVNDALVAIKSGLVGEVEPLRRYGVVLSEARVQQQAFADTGKKTKDSLTSQDKVLARVALIYKDTGLAQGDFLRTSSGLANQQRILAAAIRETEIGIGTALIPVVKDVTSGLAKWFSNTENQKRVQQDVTEAVEQTTKIVKDLTTAIKIVTAAINPMVDAVGGLANALELVIGAVFIRKITRASAAWKIYGFTASTAAKEAAVANAGFAKFDLFPRLGGFRSGAKNLGKFGLLAGGAGAIGGSLLGDNGKLSVTGAALGGSIAGPEGAIIAAGAAEFSNLVRTIPGVDSTMKSFGGKVADVANKFGFLGEKIDKNQAAIDQHTSTFLHAQAQLVFDTKRLEALRRGTGGGGGTAATGDVTVAPGALRGPATGFAIQRLRAERTKSTADDVALFKDQAAYLAGQIAILEKAGVRGKNDKDRLTGLYTDLAGLNADINAIEDDANSAKKKVLEERKQKAKEEKANALERQSLVFELARASASTEGQIATARRREIENIRTRLKNEKLDRNERLQLQIDLRNLQNEGREARKDAAAKRKEKRDRLFSNREQRLQNAAQRADLTEGEADNKRASRALIKFYAAAAARARKTGADAKALQFDSQKVAEQIKLKGQNASTPTDFFAEAAANFRQFGSNIAGRKGLLSGQDARGALAGLALERRSNTQNLGLTAAIQQVGEQVKTNALLVQILGAVGGSQGTGGGGGSQPPQRHSPTAGTARRTAAITGGPA